MKKTVTIVMKSSQMSQTLRAVRKLPTLKAKKRGFVLSLLAKYLKEIIIM